MTDQEAMKLALEALIVADKRIIAGGLASDARLQMKKAITALRQAIEQPDAIEAAVRAENEACAFIASKEAQQWQYPSHASAAAVIISDAIRARMK